MTQIATKPGADPRLAAFAQKYGAVRATGYGKGECRTAEQTMPDEFLLNTLENYEGMISTGLHAAGHKLNAREISEISTCIARMEGEVQRRGIKRVPKPTEDKPTAEENFLRGLQEKEDFAQKLANFSKTGQW